jgi:cobalt/nickel transport system permease protein
VDPVAKLLVTICFIAFTSSFPASAVTVLAPYAAYPVLLAVIGGIPARLLASRLAVVLPFAALLGAANPLVDHVPALIIGGVSISRGWMSLAGIVCRTLLIVGAALSLTALTGFDGICGALERLRLPRGLVLQLRLMFRHLSTLSEEVSRTLLAYGLRSGRRRGVAPREWGSVAGSVLVRSIGRAERIHTAMLARDGGQRRREPIRWLARPSDWLFALAWMAWFLLCRLVDLPALLGSLAQSVLHV